MDASGKTLSALARSRVFGRHTCGLVYHVHLQWEVFSINGVLAGGVEVELLQLEFLSRDCGLGSLSFHNNLDGGADIFKLSSGSIGKFNS